MNWLGDHWNDILAALKYFIGTLFSRPEDIKSNSMNLPDEPISPPITLAPPRYLWDTKDNCRHSVRVICDEEGLTVQQKNNLSATVHPNIVNGKTSSTDFGIAQINDYWHIGVGKDFPSSDYVLNNPEACIRWMCRQFKADNAKAWVCYGRGLFHNYSS